MAKKLLPPLGREKRKAGSSLPGSLSVYEPKQGKQPKTQKRRDKGAEERLRLLHDRNKAYIQQLEEKSRQMRQLEKQETERVHAFRDRLRRRILKEVSQSTRDFAVLKAERLQREKAEQAKRAEARPGGHRPGSLSASPSGRGKFAAYRSASPGYSTAGHSRTRQRPTTSHGAECRQSGVMGLDRVNQPQRPRTSHSAKPRSQPRPPAEPRPSSEPSPRPPPQQHQDRVEQVPQGSGRQVVAKLRANRVVSSAYASGPPSPSPSPSPSPPSPTPIVPTFATTVKIYRSIQCNPNPSLKRYLMWKKRNGIAFEAKVFTISGEKNFAFMREALLQRGWIENKDSSTEFFDLKWSLHSADIKHINLRQDQLVNHFELASSITTKCGLIKTLKECALASSVDASSFFPRSHELSTEDGMWEFEKDFDMTAALAVLKRAYVDLSSGSKDRLSSTDKLAVKAWEARLRHERNFVEEDADGDASWLPKLRALQWQEIRTSGSFKKPVCGREALEAMDSALLAEPPAAMVVEESESAATESSGATGSSPGDADSTASTQDHFDASGAVESGEEATSESELESLGRLLGCVIRRHKQHRSDGMHNIWIVKPGGKSRGRGIRCFNNLQEILLYVRQDLTEKWVAQKYIERPLVIHGRKFDIRQWVLVTDWNPLTVWMYKEFYLRFAVEDFDLLNLDSYIHLCNNSIVKHSDKFDAAAEEIESDGNMWSAERFGRYLVEERGEVDAVRTKIAPQIRRIVSQTLRSAQSAVKDRKETCQVFGYDFLVDDNLNVWLLEINSSPTMEPSNDLTARLCKDFQLDTVKVIVDLPREQLRRQKEGEPKLRFEGWTEGGSVAATREAGDGDDFDLGGFECLVADQMVARQPKYMGLNLVVQGKGVRRPRRRKSQFVTVLDKDPRGERENKLLDQKKEDGKKAAAVAMAKSPLAAAN